MSGDVSPVYRIQNSHVGGVRTVTNRKCGAAGTKVRMVQVRIQNERQDQSKLNLSIKKQSPMGTYNKKKKYKLLRIHFLLKITGILIFI